MSYNYFGHKIDSLSALLEHQEFSKYHNRIREYKDELIKMDEGHTRRMEHAQELQKSLHSTAKQLPQDPDDCTQADLLTMYHLIKEVGDSYDKAISYDERMKEIDKEIQEILEEFTPPGVKGLLQMIGIQIG